MNRRKPPVKSQPSTPQSVSQSTFRIIGGLWRGRKLFFPATEGLRPTPDRVRETLFNWLAGELHQADCLDLFCGSGALGLEALSRGARYCLFVDAESRATAAIRAHLDILLKTHNSIKDGLGINSSTIDNPDKNGAVITSRLPDGLVHLQQAFDVIFIDPPYALSCIVDCINYLHEHQLIKIGGWVYIENASNLSQPILPDYMQLYRQKSAGQVRYSLFQYQPVLVV